MDRPQSQTPGARYNELAFAEGWGGVCDNTLAFRHPQLAAIHAIWREQAAGRIAPMRDDMSPKLLKAYLQHVAIYERVVSENVERRWRVRLMGSKFTQVMGDFANKFVDEVVPAEFLVRWNAALDAVIDGGAPLRFYTRSDTSNKSFLIGEYFEAPLLDNDGNMNKVFAAGFYMSANDWARGKSEEALPRRI